MNFADGHVICEPVGSGSGYWAGAPGAFYDAGDKAWYLTYRLRRPRGIEPDRGGEARIARSTDLKNWEDIWSVNKNQYDSASIERSALHRGPDKLWRYFTSYVDPTDGRWCVAMMQAPDPSKFNPQNRRTVFTATPLGLEGIKDPWILNHKGTYYMFLSVARATPKTTGQSHSTLDIYNTGDCISATGLATSHDLDHWDWRGIVFQPESTGWDCYCRRINSVVPMNGSFLAFFDGSASHLENYEEKTALAISNDIRIWKTLDATAPRYTSPHSSHSLRYVDAQLHDGQSFVFYEYARADGAHDLRLITDDLKKLLSA